MKRQLIIISIFLVAFFFVINKKEEQNIPELSSHQEAQPTTPVVSNQVEAPLIVEERSEPQEEHVVTPKEATKNIRLSKVKRERRSPATVYPSVSHKALNKSGLELANKLYVTKKDQYEADMGSIVQEQGGLVFFESESGPSEHSSFVAVDKKNSKIYPISNTLKLQNVDSNKRFEVLQAGFDEFYYSEELKIMYVQAASGKLFEVYDLASKLSLAPEVEVIRGFNRVR